MGVDMDTILLAVRESQEAEDAHIEAKMEAGEAQRRVETAWTDVCDANERLSAVMARLSKEVRESTVQPQ